jgi:drug/metabolite transporter (DMT)-like permease
LTSFSILLILISAFIHSSWNFLTKRGNWPLEFFFWVFLWGVILYLPFFIGFGVSPSFIIHAPPKLWWLVISSGFFEIVYFVSLVGAYREGDLSLVYPISRSAPLFTQIWAILFIGEILSKSGITGICLVVIGLFAISLKGFRVKKGISHQEPFNPRPYLLAFAAAISSSIYSVIDKVGVQMLHPVFYLWLSNLFMTVYMSLYLLLRKEASLMKVWLESKKEILIVTVLLNMAYLLVLIALQTSKVSYVTAFRQVGTLFGAGMGVFFLKESYWKTRLSGALILTMGLVLIGLAK